jgi:hypothetical protein
MAIRVPIVSEWNPQGLNRAQADLKRAQGGWGKTGAAFKTALVPAVGALAGLGAAGLKFAKQASQDQAGAAKLAKSLKNVTGATDAQVASVEEWITAQGKALGVADDDLRPALQQLAQASGSVEQAQKDAALAMDIAASSGATTEQAAKAIAKAYDGSTGSLKKLVPGIDDAALASKDLGAIMDSTNDIVGGQAADAAGTAEGQQKRLSLALSETGESIGGVLLPVLGKLLPLLQGMATWAQNNVPIIVALGAVIGALALIIVAVNIAMKVYEATTKIVAVATKLWAGAQWLLNAALNANPIGLIIIGLIALAALFVILWKRSETFRTIVTAVFDAFMGVVRGVWDWIKGHWKLLLAILLGPIAAAVLLIIGNWDKIKAGAKTVLDWIKTKFGQLKDVLAKPFELWWGILSGIFDKIKSAIQTVLDLIGKIHLPKLPDLNPFNNSASSTLAVPMGGASVGALGAGVPSLYATGSGRKAGSSGTTIIIQGAIDPEGTARQVNKLLLGHTARQGKVSGTPRRLAW